jgi:hypothetical protein
MPSLPREIPSKGAGSRPRQSWALASLDERLFGLPVEEELSRRWLSRQGVAEGPLARCYLWAVVGAGRAGWAERATEPKRRAGGRPLANRLHGRGDKRLRRAAANRQLWLVVAADPVDSCEGELLRKRGLGFASRRRLRLLHPASHPRQERMVHHLLGNVFLSFDRPAQGTA